jgi:hypothetical protein
MAKHNRLERAYFSNGFAMKEAIDAGVQALDKYCDEQGALAATECRRAYEEALLASLERLELALLRSRQVRQLD